MDDKIDFKSTLECYRASSVEFQVLQVPPMRYLMVDGRGDPNTEPAYVEALASLYPVAYALKFHSRNDLGRDYVVPPLEGLWWSDDMSTFTTARDKSQWSWTMMLMVPDWIDGDTVHSIMLDVGATKAPPALDRVRLDALAEGRCVQRLHLGPFDAEAVVLAEMHDQYVPALGLDLVGKHHEIYLSDPRRTRPDRMRTILRQPVREVGRTT